MTTVHEPYQFISGDTWILNGVLQDAEGNAWPLGDATISWKLDTVDGVENQLSLTVGDGITVTDLATAEIEIVIPPLQSSAVPPGNYYDWLRVDLGSGQVFTEWTGVITVVIDPK